MIAPIISIGARVASLLARVVPVASWMSLGWLSSDAVNTATGGANSDQNTTAAWQLMAGGGALIGVLLTILLWKPIGKAFKRFK